MLQDALKLFCRRLFWLEDGAACHLQAHQYSLPSLPVTVVLLLLAPRPDTLQVGQVVAKAVSATGSGTSRIMMAAGGGAVAANYY